VSFQNFLALSASAGSGKTFALSIRYISLLFMGVSPSKILAATFTKKAANEMQERVIRFLKDLPNDELILNEVSKECNLSKDEIIKLQPKILQNFISSKNYIVTLDSFFSFILRSNALQIGLDVDFEIKEGNKEGLDIELISELDKNNNLNSLVKLSINVNRRKSKDLIELFELLYNIDAILPKTTYKLQNLDNLKRQIENLRIDTLQELQKSGASKSAVKNFEESDFKNFITKSFFEKETLNDHRFYKKYLNDFPKIEQNFLELKELIAKYHIALEESVLHYLFEIYNSYKSVKLSKIKAKNRLEFNDILYFTHRLIANVITKEFLYFKLDTKFLHILLDEFQDTSILQFLILKPLIDEIFAGVGISEFRSFFYVGDTKQSLYRFRGGVEELFDFVAKHYNIEIKNLDTNYRSAKLLVEKVNEIFKPLIKNYVNQKPHNKEEGYFEVDICDNQIECAIKKIRFLKESGVNLDGIAILVFTNKDAVSLQEELKKEGIESILKTSNSLKFNPKIAALVGVLKFLTTNEQIYLEPFLQKIGQKDINLDFLNLQMHPFLALKLIIQKFNYFGGDLNILRLLEFAKDKDTIFEFLEEFENSKIELTQSQNSGVVIMTIHGSKGLEFNYVILLDRFTKEPSGNEFLLFKEKNVIEIEKIFYKFKAKENFIKEYKNLLEIKKEAKFKDKINLLYVALTRAKEGLIILQKEKNSEFELLNLDTLKVGNIIKSKPKIKQNLKTLPKKIDFYGEQEVSEKKDQKEAINYSAIYFGEALHYALELIDFNNPDFKEIKNAIINRYGIYLEELKIKDLINRIKMLLNNEKFQSFIKEGIIFKEQPLVYNDNFYQLDLLIKTNSQNIIIDYKSSKSSVNDNIKQILEYKKALKKIEAKSVSSYLCYLLQDSIEFLEV
jgi:exodeoxyribonuclease V beta subunit